MGLQEYKCPCCSGGINFNSSVGKMKCPFCDSEFELDSIKELDDVLENETKDSFNWNTNAGTDFSGAETEGMAAYSCNSCGAQIITEKTTGASSCPFCDNPIVMTSTFSGNLKPDLIIPFKLDKEAAKEALKKHFEGKKLLPREFKDNNHIDDISGVYVPFWLFNSDADANIRYKATKVKRWSDEKFNYTETQYYTVARKGSLSFDNVPVDASKKMADDLMDSVEPYDFSQGVDFRTAYLAGYLADKYDVSAEDSIERANSRIKKSTEDEFRKTVTGYDTVTVENSGINLINGSTKYALLPMWILNTTWNDQKFVFGMNGQTGKLVGNLPINKKAYWKYLSLFGIIPAIALFAILFFAAKLAVAPAVIIPIVVGIISALIGTSSMKSQMKTVKLATEAANYIRKDSLKLTQKGDIYICKKLDKQPKATAESVQRTNTGNANK